MGTGPVRISYLRTVGEGRAAAWDISVGSIRSVEASGTSDNNVPWPGKGALARCPEDELWPPRVFAIAAAWMDEGFRGGGGGGGGGGGWVGDFNLLSKGDVKGLDGR